MSQIKFAPTHDDRHDVVTVWDTKGEAFQHTNTNARELVRHLNFTLDPNEGARRRVAAAPAPVIANDGTPEALQAKQAKQESTKIEAPVWEDLTTLPVEVLRKAASYFGVKDIDARWGSKRIIASLEAAIDQALSASGDFNGALPAAADASEEAKAAAQVEAIARRRRAYALAATSASVAFGDDSSISQLLTSVAALVTE